MGLFSSKVDAKSNKRLIINMLANSVAYASSIIVSFFLTPYLINTLGKEAYSFYPIANNIVSYMSVVVNAMNIVANRFITIEIVGNNKENAKKYFSTSFISNLLLCLVFMIPMILIVVFADKVLDVPINLLASVRVLFCFVFATMIVNISTSTFGVATYATNRIDLRSYRELTAAILRIVFFVVLFKFFRPTIIFVGVVALVVAMFNFIVQVYYTSKLLPDMKIEKSLYSWEFMKQIIPPSLWNMINQLGNIMLSGTLLIMANILCGAGAGADYSIVHTIPGLMNGVITMVVGVFMPMIMQHYAEGNIEQTVKQTQKAQNIVGVLGCSVLAVFVAMGKDFFFLWVPTQNAEYLQSLSVLSVIPHFIISAVWPVSSLNVIINKLKVPALYLIISGIINIVVSYVASLLFPGQLSVLILVNTIIQVMWVGVFVPLYPCKYFNINRLTFFKPLFKITIATVLSIMLAGVIRNMFVINSWIKFLAVGCLSGVTVLLLEAFIVIGPQNFKETLKIVTTKIRK